MPIQLPVDFEFRANQTFADFYPGNNQEIISLLMDAAHSSGELFIYLWGEQGHGKSHLLHACCQEAFQQSISAFYLDLSAHIGDSPELLMGLEDIELVCLDNIDVIAGNEAWELACFHLFNRIHEENHRLIITASCAVNSLNIILPDLLTRLGWGLTLKIQPLDDDDKIAALIHKAQRRGIEITPQVARYLVARYDRNLASLWLMLDKLDWASLATQRKLTIPFLREFLKTKLIWEKC
jgi:DnaA-homolog protein